MPVSVETMAVPKAGDYWFAPRSGHRALLRMRPDENRWTLSVYRVGRDGTVDMRSAAGTAGTIDGGAWYALAVMAGVAEVMDPPAGEG